MTVFLAFLANILVAVAKTVAAIILIRRNIAFLVGASAAPELRARVGTALLGLDQIERVTYLHIEYVGPNRLFIVAEIDLSGDAREHDVARRLRELEQRIEEHEAVEASGAVAVGRRRTVGEVRLGITLRGATAAPRRLSAASCRRACSAAGRAPRARRR